MRTVKNLIISFICLSVFATLPAFADISKRKDVRRFINHMVKTEGFKKADLISVFKRVKTHKSIIKTIKRPAEAKPWYQYRKIFLTDERINGGVKFWNDHADSLKRAEEKYGVPAEIIIAIIGVETKYGKHKGKFPVMDALSTLAFNYPRRSKFFKQELKQFLILSREEKVDPMSFVGSYAGAMGKPQFMPSSYRNYAVDFDGDGHRDLLNNVEDVIGSVANYFVRHKWVRDGQVTAKAAVKGRAYRKVVKKGIKPHSSVAKLEKSGIKAREEVDKGEKAALIELKLKKGHEYWLGLSNFYVITRYNHSQHYAMAVYQLSQEIAKARKVALAKTSN